MTARRSVWTSVESLGIAPALALSAFPDYIFSTAGSLRSAASLLLVFAMLWAALAGANEARAQEPETGLVAQGDLVISGFSGKVAPPAAPPLPAGTSELDETLIDVGGASIKVLDVSAPGGGGMV